MSVIFLLLGFFGALALFVYSNERVEWQHRFPFQIIGAIWLIMSFMLAAKSI